MRPPIHSAGSRAAASGPERASFEPPQPLASSLIDQWMLDPLIDFLNHGCFGARPRIVAESQQRWRERIDSRPVELIDRRRGELLAEAKAPVARLIGASPDDFGFVSNATGGVNAVLRSLDFQPGDELLSINHVYNAIRMAMRYLAQRVGVNKVEARLPFPIDSPQTVIDTIDRHLTARTKLLIIDEITSPTALRLPVSKILDLCASRNVDVLIDGAHAPGMIDIDLGSLQPAYYTGNLHKWAAAPMGTAFLWVRPDRQDRIHPLTISHFLGQGLAAEFAWQGTRDHSGWLSAPDGIRYLEQFGLDRVRQHNHAMARWAHIHLAQQWQVEMTSPADGSMLGAMATLPLPEGVRARWQDPVKLHDVLYDEHRFEVPIIDWEGRWWIRVSCQIYNTADQYRRLGEEIASLS